MIKGRKKIVLNSNNIFKKISEYDIFKMYMPFDFKVNQITNSPFREDKNPSFLISNRYGSLNYIDYGRTEFRGDCIHFVKQLFNLSSMDETLKKIDYDFGLGISSSNNKGDYKSIVRKYEQPESIGKRYAKIQVLPKKFTKMDLAYWNSFHQSKDDLIKENVFSIKKIFLNKKRFSFDITQPIFGYYYEGHWKIYRPFESKERKWLPNNVPITFMDGKENIKNVDTAFVNGSKKDYMVIKKILASSCAVQNEGIGCFSKDNVKFLRDNSRKQVLSFDSDVAGVESSLQITDMFGFGYCNVPKKYLAEGIKDWADLAKKHGMSNIESYFKSKGLI